MRVLSESRRVGTYRGKGVRRLADSGRREEYTAGTASSL
ncbi:MAG: hypothetical protein AVDCRST_MAG68-4491 [uncultured Gemmatimonadetes bacterium]|uniref:Uncharacterized protein n=1 Tax=uncultured Gemmatimonadota bacterium TaxID=203437 RepID=A0A6J4MQE5_9BACT|nr:MAG: hypothetical protein AVDCRST_MAG68-4491 [uncultured Gemmatimonadota bacterium]